MSVVPKKSLGKGGAWGVASIYKASGGGAGRGARIQKIIVHITWGRLRTISHKNCQVKTSSQARPETSGQGSELFSARCFKLIFRALNREKCWVKFLLCSLCLFQIIPPKRVGNHSHWWKANYVPRAGCILWHQLSFQSSVTRWNNDWFPVVHMRKQNLGEAK
jgi:hypothetical protein